MPVIKRFDVFKEVPFIKNSKKGKDVLKDHHLKFVKKHSYLKEYTFKSDYNNNTYVWTYEKMDDNNEKVINITKEGSKFCIYYDAEIDTNGLIEKESLSKKDINLTNLYNYLSKFKVS